MSLYKKNITFVTEKQICLLLILKLKIMATKKWVCPVCGYVHEGDTPPEKCPQCKVPGSKFKEIKENAGLNFVTEHVLGVANDIPDNEDGRFVLQGLN